MDLSSSARRKGCRIISDKIHIRQPENQGIPHCVFPPLSQRLLDAVTIESAVGFAFRIELTAKRHRPGWKIGEVPARWFARSEGKSRLRVFDWAGGYLRCYLYIFGTTFLRQQRAGH